VDSIDAKDVALLIVAGYLAVMALVRLMLGYREHLVQRFRQEMRRERQARKAQGNAAAAAPSRRAG
jgi:hypothetical protein